MTNNNTLRYGLRSQVFLGDGDRSLSQIGRMHYSLNKGLEALSELQQCAFDLSKEEREILEDTLESSAKELYLGLTGRRPKDD